MRARQKVVQRYLEKASSAKDGQKEGDRSGVGLFIPLPKELAAQFPSLVPEDHSPPHTTFLYIGEVAEKDEKRLLEVLQQVVSASKWPRVRGKLHQLDYFQHPDKERTVAHMSVSFNKSLGELRTRLRSALEDAELPCVDSFPVYRPHVTLGYMPGLDTVWKGQVPQGQWEFDEIEVWGLPKVHTLKMGQGKTAARPIPVDKSQARDWANLIAKQISKEMHKYYEPGSQESVMSKARVSGKDKAFFRAGGTKALVVKDVRGNKVEVPVWVYLNNARKKLPNHQFVAGGFVLSSTAGATKKPNQLGIRLDANLPASAWFGRHAKERVSKELYSVLVHEMTHLRDLMRVDRNPVQHETEEAKNLNYVNRPHEVRAFMQQIADEVETEMEEIAKDTEGWGLDTSWDFVEERLYNSPTWNQIKQSLNPRSKKLMLRAIARVVSDAHPKLKKKYFVPNDDKFASGPKLPGGIGDKAQEKDFDPRQVAKGVKVEMEHTKDKAMAKEIALDHLTEDSKYYDKLETIEKHARIAALHLAKRTPFNVDFIKVLRKEFLTLMKNAKVVKDYRQAQAWREAMANWRERFNELIYKRLTSTIGNIPLQYEWVPREEANKWDKYVRKETWDLYLNSRVPVDRADDYWSEEARFRQFQGDLKKWDGRVRRGARKAWKALEGFVSWYKHVTSQVPTVDMPSSEQVNIEGFRVLVKDYDPSFDLSPVFMERFKVGLRHYKQRAKQVLPLLLQKQVPLVLDFKKDLSAAGTYHGRFIEMNPSASEKNPGAMAKVLAHEMGHHIWQTHLSKDAQDFWRRTITGNYGTLDLRQVLKRYGNEKDFWENKRIKREDPLLYLQIDGLYHDLEYKNIFAPRSGKAIWTMDGVREYLDNGGRATWRVQGKPITGYAQKNPEEAFCEAIGMLVGYGPRTVLPEVRHWLKTILPQIKVAKMQDSWLEISPDHLYRGEEEEAEDEEASFEKTSPPIDPTPMSLKEAVAKRYLEASEHEKQIALMKWMSRATQKLGVARHTYVVGGAVRNFVIDRPIKDLDIVIDSVNAGKDSDWLGKQLARLIPVPANLTTNQYGVAILTVKGDWDLDGQNLKGEVIEIANARKESYGKGDDHGKGYKPTSVEPSTIKDDMIRRDFTVNALMWRLMDLAKGPEKAEIIDLTGCGLRDLQDGNLRCPADPDKTFSDDATRMLRLLKFTGKYGFKIPPDVVASVKRNVKKLKGMPWEAIGTILVENILKEPTARKSLKQMKDLGILDVVSEMVQAKKPFQKYLSNQLRKERRVQLLLDLMELGVPASTSLSFLDRKQQAQLRQMTLAMPEDKASDFADKLIKPPVDNKRLIDELSLPGPERRHIAPRARTLMLIEPSLANSSKKLTDKLISTWALKMASETLTSKVASRYIEKVAREFTEEEWKTHKEKHPGADAKNHTIKKKEDGDKKDDEPKSSLKDKIKAVLAQAKGASKAMVKSIQDAPEKVQRFVSDKEYRDQTMRQAAKTIKAAPGKIKDSVKESAKSELKAIFVETPKILGTLAKEKRLPTKEEAKTLYGVGVYVAGTALALSGGTPMAAALAGAKAFGHSLGLHIGIKAASKYADETFLAYEAVESAATGAGIADALPLATGSIPGLNQVLDGMSRLLGASEKDSAHDMDDLLDKLIENVADVLESGMSDEEMKKVLEEKY